MKSWPDLAADDTAIHGWLAARLEQANHERRGLGARFRTLLSARPRTGFTRRRSCVIALATLDSLAILLRRGIGRRRLTKSEVGRLAAALARGGSSIARARSADAASHDERALAAPPSPSALASKLKERPPG